MASAVARGVLSEQWGALRLFVRRRELLVVVAIYWVERLSNGLNAAVVPFFLQSLGLSPSQMGALASLARAALLTTAPMYGWLVDAHGPLHAIMAASALCSAGCMLRGFSNSFGALGAAMLMAGAGGANLVPLSSAHLARETHPSLRPLVLSAFAVQGAVLRIIGQGAYVPWDALLDASGMHERLVRFRVTLSICSFGCFFGVINLWMHGHLLRRTVSRVDQRHWAALSWENLGATASKAIRPQPQHDAKVELADDSEAFTTALRAPADEHAMADAHVAIEAFAAHESARGAVTLRARAQHASHGLGFFGVNQCARCPTHECDSTTRHHTNESMNAACYIDSLSKDADRRRSQWLPMCLVLASSFMCNMSDTVVQLVWPLYLSHHYGADERTFGGLLFASTLLVTLSSVAVPALIRTLNPARAVAHLGSAAAFSMTTAFVTANFGFAGTSKSSSTPRAVSPHSIDKLAIAPNVSLLAALPGHANEFAESGHADAYLIHVWLALLAVASLGGLDLCLRATGSILASQDQQGRSFASLNLAASLGGMIGGIYGGELFQLSLASATAGEKTVSTLSLPVLLQGGALPTVLLAPGLVACSTALACMLKHRPELWVHTLTAASAGDLLERGDIETKRSNSCGTTTMPIGTVAAEATELANLTSGELESAIHSKEEGGARHAGRSNYPESD